MFHKLLNRRGRVAYDKTTLILIFVWMWLWRCIDVEMCIHCLCVSEGTQQRWNYVYFNFFFNSKNAFKEHFFCWFLFFFLILPNHICNFYQEPSLCCLTKLCLQDNKETQYAFHICSIFCLCGWVATNMASWNQLKSVFMWTNILRTKPPKNEDSHM